MTIGMMIPEFPGQTHTMFWREIAALRAMGKTVRILSTRPPAPGSCRHAFADSAAAETYYVYPPRWRAALGTLAARPRGTLRALGYLLRLRESTSWERLKALGFLICAADLLAYCRRNGVTHVHVHSCAHAAHVAALAHALGGPAYSLTLHGDLPVYGKDHATKMAKAKFVLTAGPHLRPSVVERAQYPEARVLPSFMGIDLAKFDPIPARTAEPGRLRLVTVARLHRCKGHRYALAATRRAIDRGCDLRYTVAGDGPHAEEIRAEATRLGLVDRVVFTGTLAESEVVRVLAEADAFVLPSVGAGEAYPVSVMEAMASGLPVIASIIGSTPEMITPGVEGFLIAQEDIDGLTNVIVALAQDPEVRLRMGAAAGRRAVEAFNVRATASRLLEAIYD
jgi:colanic acid/amylovoran biosynthesis glycosyltransferase